MKFKELIKDYCPRGSLIRNFDMYFKRGNFPVFSAQTTGPFGYINEYNYIATEDTYIFSLNGNAGFVSLVKPGQRLWLTSDAGALEMKDEYRQYDKMVVALWLQDFFVKNRHNNGTQPKFSILTVLEKDIDTDILKEKLEVNFKDIKRTAAIGETIQGIDKRINATSGNNLVTLKNFIFDYYERGERKVKGRDLYINYGKIKVISAQTTGCMGFYNKANYRLSDNHFLYTIDGVKAGSILLMHKQDIFLTDHAGIIEVPKTEVTKYGRVAIALWLQNYFMKNRTRNGSQPTFMLKNVLDMEMDLDKLSILSEYNLDQFL